MRPLFRGTSIVLAFTLLSGCALRQERSQPVNAAPPAAPESLSEYMQKVRHLSVNARPVNKSEAAETLETRDPAIAAELLLVSGPRRADGRGGRPTAERFRSLAERYEERRVLDAAYRNFNRAIALDPRDAAAYEGLARVWRDWGLPWLALADAHRATYYAPRSASARNTYGTIMQALGRDDDARAAYEAASRLDPQAAYAVNNLCYLAFLKGQLDSAIEICTSALAIDSSLTAARNNLALAFAAAGRDDLARTQFVDAGDRASGLYNMGIAYLAAGDLAGAVNAFDEASRTRPSFQLARKRAAQIRAQIFWSQREQRLNGAAAGTERTNGLPDRPLNPSR